MSEAEAKRARREKRVKEKGEKGEKAAKGEGAKQPSQMVEHVAAAAGLSKGDARKAVAAMLGYLAEELAAGKAVALKGVGKFKSVDKPARERTKDGETVSVPAHKATKFAPAKTLKERLSAS